MFESDSQSWPQTAIKKSFGLNVDLSHNRLTIKHTKIFFGLWDSRWFTGFGDFSSLTPTHDNMPAIWNSESILNLSWTYRESVMNLSWIYRESNYRASIVNLSLTYRESIVNLSQMPAIWSVFKFMKIMEFGLKWFYMAWYELILLSLIHISEPTRPY